MKRPRNPDDPRLGRPCPHQVEPFPVGTVRVVKAHTRADGKVVRVRRIKVRMDGPANGRWVDFAGWWWRKYRGPVPAGKCVLHLDGDTLNDDPTNLAVGTHADRIALWHIRNPEASAAQLARAHAGCAEHNRVRGQIRRLTSWNRTHWYPVDPVRRVVLLEPKRKKLAVYQARGLVLREHREGAALAAALGFPMYAAGAASVLAALLEGAAPGSVPPWRTSAQVLASLEALRRPRGWKPLGPAGFYLVMVRLRRAGLAVSRRGGAGPGCSTYRATMQAAELRLPPCPWIPMLGRDLAGEAFAGFTRCHPDGRAVERDRRPHSPMSRLFDQEVSCPNPRPRPTPPSSSPSPRTFSTATR